MKAGPRRGSGNGIMWDGITTDITATKVAEIRIKQSEQQLRQLSSHVETLKEDERARVSREIHDDLGGTLTAIKMDLMSFASRLPQRSKGLSTKIAGIDRLVDHAIEASVRISAACGRAFSIAGSLPPSMANPRIQNAPGSNARFTAPRKKSH